MHGKAHCEKTRFPLSPISVKSAEAQKFFDQGLRLVLCIQSRGGYTIVPARRVTRFEDCDDVVGVALAVGPNYNLPVDAEHEKTADEAVEQAGSLRTAPTVTLGESVLDGHKSDG